METLKEKIKQFKAEQGREALPEPLESYASSYWQDLVNLIFTKNFYLENSVAIELEFCETSVYLRYVGMTKVWKNHLPGTEDSFLQAWLANKLIEEGFELIRGSAGQAIWRLALV